MWHIHILRGIYVTSTFHHSAGNNQCEFHWFFFKNTVARHWLVFIDELVSFYHKIWQQQFHQNLVQNRKAMAKKNLWRGRNQREIRVYFRILRDMDVTKTSYITFPYLHRGT